MKLKMELKKIFSMIVIGMMTISIGGQSFANSIEVDVQNPHLSNQFEITQEEALNNPSKEEIELKEKIDNLPSSKTSANGAIRNNSGISFVNVRSGPGTGYSVKVKLSDMTPVVKSSTSNGWTKITAYKKNINSGYTSITGYISSEYVSTSSGRPVYYGVHKTTSNLNVRSGPGTSYSILHTLSSGVQVGTIGMNGFIKVWSGYNLRTGYASSNYLKYIKDIQV